MPRMRRALSPRYLAGRLFGRRSRRSGRAVGLVLMHHGLAEAHEDAATALVPALGANVFRAQLEYLARRHEVVALRELPARMRERSAGERIPVAITFDDDLAAHRSIAAPILEEFGFPATFFLNGNTLEGPSAFWWQDLQTIVDRGPEAWTGLRDRLGEDWPWARLDASRQELIATIEASPREQRDAIAAVLRELAGGAPPDPGLPSAAVRELVERGFEIGSHTLRHYLLPTLDDRELERAMTDGLDELAAVTGYRPTAIAYPHGKADLRVADAALRAGFELGFTTGHAAATPEQHPLLIGRVVAHTDSVGSFAWALGRLAA